MSDAMKKIVACLQEAVDSEMERKAKLGYKAVVLGKDGKPKVVSAKTIVSRRRLLKMKKMYSLMFLLLTIF